MAKRGRPSKTEMAKRIQEAGGVAPPVPPEVTAIPATRDKDGFLLKLTRAQFPKSKNGLLAFCDYQLEKWGERRLSVMRRDDPKTKMLRRREKLLAKLAELEAEIDEESDGDDNGDVVADEN